MTDAERNRRVAEICGYEVHEVLQVFEQLPNGNTRYLGSVREPERDDWGEVPDGLGCFDPLHNANQAIEALTKKFGERWTATHSERGTVIAATTEDRRACVGVVKDPDPVRAFCQAAVAAIEAAGGKG